MTLLKTHDWREFVPSWPWLVVSPVLFLVAMGCVRTVHPVLKNEQVLPIDKSLAGIWVSDDGKESADIEPDADKEKTYKILYTDKDGKQGRFVARLGKIENSTVAEYTLEDPGHGSSAMEKPFILPVYSFIIVDQTSPQIVALVMNDDWLKKYIKDNPNELQVISDGDDLIVTASTADFQAFLLRHLNDPGAYGGKVTFVRPGDATTRAATTRP